MKAKLSAVALDMDGVVANSNPLHSKAATQALKDLGLNVPDGEWEKLFGRPIHKIAKLILEQYGSKPPTEEDIEDLIKSKTAIYQKLATTQLKAIEGVAEFIDYAKRSFEQVSLVTSSPRLLVDSNLAKMGLAGQFDVEVTMEDITIGKPDPEPYLLACKKMHLQPHEVLVVEDAPSGVQSAKAAKCFTVAITTTFPAKLLEESSPDLVVDSFKELEEFLSKGDYK